MSEYQRRHERREFVLARLQAADGLSYDEICRETAAAFPHPWSGRAVRAVRRVLWDGLAVTEPDESVWLTPEGWKAAEQLQAGAA